MSFKEGEAMNNLLKSESAHGFDLPYIIFVSGKFSLYIQIQYYFGSA